MPRAEDSTRAARRPSRVSSRLALITQNAQVRRYQGACAWNQAQAAAFARKRLVNTGESSACCDSNE